AFRGSTHVPRIRTQASRALCWAGNVALTRQPTMAAYIPHCQFDVGRTGGLLHMRRAEDGSQPVAISRCRGSCGYLSRSSPMNTAYHARPLSVKSRLLFPMRRVNRPTDSDYSIELVHFEWNRRRISPVIPCAVVLHYCGSQEGSAPSS